MEIEEWMKLLEESGHATHGAEFLIEHWPEAILLTVLLIVIFAVVKIPCKILNKPPTTFRRFNDDVAYAVIPALITALL